jgi:hypothetical protein
MGFFLSFVRVWGSGGLGVFTIDDYGFMIMTGKATERVMV